MAFAVGKITVLNDKGTTEEATSLRREWESGDYQNVREAETVL